MKLSILWIDNTITQEKELAKWLISVLCVLLEGYISRAKTTGKKSEILAGLLLLLVLAWWFWDSVMWTVADSIWENVFMLLEPGFSVLGMETEYGI